MMASIVLTLIVSLAPTSTVDNSTHGYMDSQYTGKWYAPKWEDERKCIMQRESRFNYRAANGSSSARGAYQFLDSQWRDSLVWMMLEEGGDRKEIKSLRNKPIHKWSRYYQDRAFFTAWQHGEGASHWYYPGHNCY